ncbi:MobV family relaxase [Hymenobacter sediminis]|uniref:MobV family relaxase n=1 Tax=Hymenobacter sediminis TaxID=2218621 RepID=UPI001390184D|nr:MobV family relaxase [Hymenobacter sediminis]
MAYAILRVTKIASREQAVSVAHHNYRTQETPNADPALRHLNQELINHAQRSYWELANERIAERQLLCLRKDAVRCVEVLLTASGERFDKDPVTGGRTDIRELSWVRANLAFLRKRYGVENVIGCMLHQDESTSLLPGWSATLIRRAQLFNKPYVAVRMR